MDALLIAGIVLVVLLAFNFLLKKPSHGNLPPSVSHLIPWFGVASRFGADPVKLLRDGYEKFGEIFSIHIFGERITVLTGPEASQLFFTAREDQFNAQKAYRFTVPVFGKGVVYDCEGEILIEQKKFMKTGLNIPRFKGYVDLIVEEVNNYFDAEWGDSGTKDLLTAFSQVTVFTSIRCLQGKEIRDKFNLYFADLYNDLDAALSPIGFFFPNLPLPSMRRRDSARKKLNQLFDDIIKNRLANPNEEHEDMLSTFMKSEYKDGRTLTNDQIVGLMIALLLAGQHTSNVTSTWLALLLMANKDEMKKCVDEQKEVMSGKPRLTYEDLEKMECLHRAMKETLRMRPPIVILMRRVLQDVQFKNYTIPQGSIVASSPALNHNVPAFWKSPEKFDPDRFINNEGKSAMYSYIPFGNGRHQCTGEQFAFLQVKTILSTLLRKYKLEMVGQMPEPNFTTLIAGPNPPVMVKYEKIK